MLTPVNATTARLAANLSKEGRQVLFSPGATFGVITGDSWVDLGLFPPAEKIALTTNITSTDIKAADPNGGPDLLLRTDVTDVVASYDSIPVLTPDEDVRALHVGAIPVALPGTLVGAFISPFSPGASILGRLIVIRRHAGTDAARLFKVYWHPRVGLQNAGEGDSQGDETMIFKAAIQSFTGQSSLPGDLATVGAQVTALGSIFTVPANMLDALLTVLNTAAAFD